MSRSGYTDDIDDVLSYGRWRGAVCSAMRGKRGQDMMKELLSALDAMPEKKLYPNSFEAGEGQFCTLGVLGNSRGTQINDLLKDEDYCDTVVVAQRFGIANALACEIMYENDEGTFDVEETPEQRFARMRRWVVDNIIQG